MTSPAPELHKCERCGKVCSSSWNLAQHRSRQTPCTIETAGLQEFRCKCEKLYKTLFNLQRHKKSCEVCLEPKLPAQPPQSGQQIVGNQVGGNLVCGNFVQMVQVVGWPEKWGPPPAPPRPFEPPGFELTPAMLERAFAKSRVGGQDPATVARTYAALLEELHASPQERNMYLSPKRADQALVYQPPYSDSAQRWQLRGLQGAIATAFDGISAQLECASACAPHLRARAADACEGFAAHREQVLRTSCAPLAAHLENLRLGGEEVWTVGGEGGAGPVNLFGREYNGHLLAESLPASLETALGLYAPGDWATLPDPAAAAQRAVHVFARLMLSGQPGNLTVRADADPGRVRVHTAGGWQPLAAAEAATRLFRRMGELLQRYLAAASSPALAPLAEYLGRSFEALAAQAGQGLLSHYVRAAAHHAACQN